MIYKTFLRIQTETKIALTFEREFKNQNFFSPYKYRMSKEASLEKSVGKELSIEQDKYLKTFTTINPSHLEETNYLHTLKKIILKSNCLEDKLTSG